MTPSSLSQWLDRDEIENGDEPAVLVKVAALKRVALKRQDFWAAR